MKLHRVIEDAYRIFIEQANHTRLVLLHPTSRYRSVLVAQLLNDPSTKTFYYALGPDDISLQAFISGITHDLANQHPTFGRHLNMLLPDALADSNLLLSNFARDLTELHNDLFYLILDEYDRSDIADDIQFFIEKLIPLLPPHCRIVINSRTLPRIPWVSLIARRSAIILKDDSVIQRDFYNIQGGEQRLEVYALGPGFVLLNDKPIDTWEGHLPRLLFFFALDRPMITRSEICHTFWPELDSDQAVNVFHVTKRRLHKALNMDVLVHENGYYRINPELDVHYDAMNFVTHLIDGRKPNNPAQLNAYQLAVDTYRGPFLQGHTDAWIMDRREDYLEGFLEALMAMARVRIEEERYEHALGMYNRALTEDYGRETLHRDVMRLYLQMGRRSEAAAHYQRFADHMIRNGRNPDSETQALYQSIING